MFPQLNCLECLTDEETVLSGYGGRKSGTQRATARWTLRWSTYPKSDCLNLLKTAGTTAPGRSGVDLPSSAQKSGRNKIRWIRGCSGGAKCPEASQRALSSLIQQPVLVLPRVPRVGEWSERCRRPSVATFQHQMQPSSLRRQSRTLYRHSSAWSAADALRKSHPIRNYRIQFKP